MSGRVCQKRVIQQIATPPMCYRYRNLIIVHECGKSRTFMKYLMYLHYAHAWRMRGGME